MTMFRVIQSASQDLKRLSPHVEGLVANDDNDMLFDVDGVVSFSCIRTRILGRAIIRVVEAKI